MFKMTEEQFVKEVRERRQAYIQAAVDYMDALEHLDFEKAMEHAMSAADILGMDIMTEVTRWYVDNDTEELDDKFEKVGDELLEAVKTDEERNEEKNDEMRQEMVSNLTKMTLGD